MSFLLRSGANFEGFLALMPVHAGIPALMACSTPALVSPIYHELSNGVLVLVCLSTWMSDAL